jgi:hypothetical protein
MSTSYNIWNIIFWHISNCMHIPVTGLTISRTTMNMLISVLRVCWANPEYTTLIFSLLFYFVRSCWIHLCCMLIEYLNFCACFINESQRGNKYFSRDSWENNKKNGSGLGALFQTIWYVGYVSTLKNVKLKWLRFDNFS